MGEEDDPPGSGTVTATGTPRSATDIPVGGGAASIQSMVVRCGHGPRGGGRSNGQTLMVVADTGALNLSISQTYGVSPAQVTVSGSYARGGNDSAATEITLRGGSASSRRQTCKTIASGAPADSAWQSPRAYDIANPDNLTPWPINVAPTISYINARGADGTFHTVQVHAYPNQQYSVSAQMAVFQRMVEQINTRINGTLRGLFGPIEIRGDITAPSGSLGLAWGWKEHTDWQAYFRVEVTAGLTPVFGYSIEVRLSLSHLATTVGLSALGIPPNIASMVADFGRDWLGDLYVFTNVGLTFNLTGSLEGRFFPSGDNRMVGRITPGFTGTVGIGMGGRAGSRYLTSVEVRGEATVGLTFNCQLELRREGFFITPSLSWPGVTLTVRFTWRAGEDTTLMERSGSWNPISGSELWSAGPFQVGGSS